MHSTPLPFGQRTAVVSLVERVTLAQSTLLGLLPGLLLLIVFGETLRTDFHERGTFLVGATGSHSHTSSLSIDEIATAPKSAYSTKTPHERSTPRSRPSRTGVTHGICLRLRRDASRRYPAASSQSKEGNVDASSRRCMTKPIRVRWGIAKQVYWNFHDSRGSD